MDRRTTVITRLAGAVAVAGLAATTAFASTGANADDEWYDVLPEPSGAALDAVEHDEAFEISAGAILVSEPPMAGPPSPDDLADAPIADAPSQSEAMSLHSKPGASKVIFLDMDGDTFSGTAWNNGRADPIAVGAYSREKSGSENESFSDSELAAIVEIWERVSEDFAPWDVDVTTEDPGEDALRRTSPSDEEYGTHVVITHDSGWYAPSGGVAYINSFGSTYYSPAFVFSNHLAQGSPKSVAEAASHEAGHTLGLLHDGKGGTSYYSGHGDWAPIMGVGYSRQVTQWSKGEYSGANNTGEDDLAEIDAWLPGRAPQSAEVALPDADSTTTGTITTGGGTDTYRIDLTATADVTLSQVSPGGNLLAELIVSDLSGGGTTVRTLSPPTDPYGWSHSIDGLTAGSYQIKVRSIGYGSASTGFTTYASIGQYVLDVDRAETSDPTTTTTTTSTVPSSDPPANDEPDVDPKSTDEVNKLAVMSPGRLLDTRSGNPGRLKAGTQIRVPVAGKAGVADDAVAAVVNVVAVKPAANGWISVTPCTDVDISDRTSSLNFNVGQNIGNSTIATLSDDGDICIFASAATDVVVDVTGSIGPNGSVGLAGTQSRRLIDTRNGIGLSTKLAPNQRVEIFFGPVLDEKTTAIALNLTAIAPTFSGFLTLDDCGEGTGETAALNYTGGENRGNNGIFALSAKQSLCLGNTAATHLTIDLTGEFQPDGMTFEPAEPVRLLDTRDQSRVSAKASLSFDVPDSDGGDTPRAASVNLTSAQHPAAGFVTSWGCGKMPESSALNPVAGQVTANGALVSLNDTSRSCLFHSSGGQLIVDLNGWWV